MNNYTKKTALIVKEKTKEIWGTDNPNVMVMKNFCNITTDNDHSQAKELESIAISSTTTTCRVFEFLEQTGIPTAYIKQQSETEIVAKNCKMIPLEVVAHRYAVGNLLKQRPELKKEEGELPHRFHRLFFEVSLKTPNSELTIDKVLPQQIELKQIEALTRKTFLVLESAWSNLGYRLINLKLEFGVTNDGELVVSNIIDNDSWQLQTQDWKEVEGKCARVAQLVSLFRIPKQAIVFWRGSETDKVPEISQIAGLNIEYPVISAHKKPTYAVEELERIHTIYPEGGVIIALVGMSNGLGPTLSARTDWPVISVCTTANEHPEDVWSNLRMPSEVPNLTVLSPKNAILSAFNILGEKNPAIYAHRRLAIEALDK